MLDEGIFVRIGSTSIVDLDIFGDVTLYPNPLENGILNIKSDISLDLISVYDTFGRLLVSSSNNTSVDLSVFSNKVFIVVLWKDDENTTRKVIAH